MRIFITGIAGFIGFHVAQVLRKRGDEVFGCDNFNSYYSPELKRERARELEKQGVDVLEADICAPGFLKEQLGALGITHALHLAAQAGVRYSMKNPEAYLKANVDGFLHVLEALRAHPHIKLTYASSSSVYGSNTKVPFTETDPADRACSLYGATKKANEVMAHAYHHMYGLHTTGLRFFTVYGPWGRPDMAYYAFTEKVMAGEPLQIYNEGKMARDFTYIDDIVQGVLAAIDLGAPFEIFNLGNHHPEAVLDLVAIIEKLVGKKAKVELLKEGRSEVPLTYADITKSASILDFKPKTSLEEGMEKFFTWFLTQKNR